MTAARFYIQRQQAEPSSMTRKVSEDLQKRQAALDKFLANKDEVKRMLADSLTADEVDALAKEPFYIFAFKDDYDLVFWNTNTVVGTCIEDLGDNSSVYRYNGVYYKQCFSGSPFYSNRHFVVLFPVRYNYSVSNEYLQSNFAAADYIPVSTKVSDAPSDSSFVVRNAHSKRLFYLDFQTEDLPTYIPDVLFSSFLILALLSSILWLNIIAVTLARKYHPLYGLLLLVAAITGILSIIYTGTLPFYLNELTIFSSSLYASSYFLPSLGILIIDLLCSLWLLNFITFHVKLKVSTNFIVRSIITLSCVLAIVTAVFIAVSIISTLVVDSNISFDAGDFYSLNLYSFVGLFTIITIFYSDVLLVYWCNRQLKWTLTSLVIKYILLVAVFGVCLLIFGKPLPACIYGFILFVFVIILMFDFAKDVRIKMLSVQTLVIGILIAATATWLLHHYNNQKQRDKQKLFAEKVARQRDMMMEFLFYDTEEGIATDTLLQDYFEQPTGQDRSFVDEHIATRYLRGQLNKYQTEIYFFNGQGGALFNRDTLKLSQIDQKIAEGVSADSLRYLYYFENAKDAKYYLAKIPLKNERGCVVLFLQLKRAVSASVYPELLQPATFKKSSENNYSYGLYAKRELIAQSNEYPFPLYLRSDGMKVGELKVLKREGYNINIYKLEDGKRVAIIDEQQKWLEIITLFSYLLGTLVLVAVIISVASLYAQYILKQKNHRNYLQLTLRNRIHFAMLSVVMLTFFILGVVTILVSIDRYDNNNKVRLRTTMQTVEREVQQYLLTEKLSLDTVSFHKETQTNKFKTFIANLAEQEGFDINIYNALGSLNATSQEDVYNKTLLARIMMPDAYYNLSQQNKTLLVQKEQIGKLSYLSSYVPLRNYEGQAIGYINVPFFSSQKELNYQISNILVAIINLYVFIFLVSSLLAVGITNWITKGFQVLIEKFKTFDLKENETIAYEYDDEIGLLLKEYNKMVEKVIQNAKKLAQSERESAWREMAQQVAHEIKNPLTPMKLNVQYLQQAIARKNPNVTQLTENVAASLIEQIDALTNIASAFSDFAKMPAANPEIILLNDLLKNVKELFSMNNNASVFLNEPDEILKVYADKNQLIRVCNNLLKNALEAVSEEKDATIILLLKRQKDAALICIQDNGTGISKEIQEKIFSPYFTTKGSGTGLGLAMTKKIIEFWNGKIWFETTENEGTRFFIELPLLEE